MYFLSVLQTIKYLIYFFYLFSNKNKNLLQIKIKKTFLKYDKRISKLKIFKKLNK